MTSEQHSSAPDPREMQALNDITTLAFWGIDFQPCEHEIRPFVPENEQGNIFGSKLREKEGYDYTRECDFTAVQLQGTIYNDGGLETIDLIVVFWHDGHSAAVNTVDLHTEQRTHTRTGIEREPSPDSRILIDQVKTVLAQLADIAS